MGKKQNTCTDGRMKRESRNEREFVEEAQKFV
jgi:hypothetical protein